MAKLFGGIEAGGTKFVLGLGESGGVIAARARIDTTCPEETIGRAIAWLRDAAGTDGLSALGIASFGPLDLDRMSPTWGHITRTAKPGWSGTDMVSPFASALGCPVAIDTDVNGAALAESRWGAAEGTPVSVYVTVGTGIGGGAIVHGRTLNGAGHPEMGHVRPARHPDDLDFAGICPFHGACLEGLASGSAIAARWGCSLSDLPPEHSAHAIIAWYLAQLCGTLRAVLAPGRIVIGGGVMTTPGLLDRVRAQATALEGGYFAGEGAAIIVPPGLGADSGLRGALALADAGRARGAAPGAEANTDRTMV